MQKLKHIKYTKLSPIMSETVPSPVESPFCRTCAASRREHPFSNHVSNVANVENMGRQGILIFY